jgi:hypothetical protein
VGGTPDELFGYLQKINDTSNYNDESIGEFKPYYFQAATQLGSPDVYTPHLEILRRYDYDISQYTPRGVNVWYSNSAMQDVGLWVKGQADKIIFVYGEFDPWTAGAFATTETGRDVKSYMAPKANHSAKFTKLSPNEKSEVVAKLSKWLQKSPQVSLDLATKRQTLEDLEFRARRGL